jgi:hypothetical protein
MNAESTTQDFFEKRIPPPESLVLSFKGTVAFEPLRQEFAMHNPLAANPFYVSNWNPALVLKYLFLRVNTHCETIAHVFLQLEGTEYWMMQDA